MSESPKSTNPYPRAPIIEAVIEVRYEAPLDSSMLRSASEGLKKNYPRVQEMHQFQVQVDQEAGAPVPKASAVEKQYRRWGSDERHLLTLTPHTFAMSQLAPYENWMTFFARFKRDWASWTSKVKRPKICRLGLRYVNRIDIPNDNSGTIRQAEYVSLLLSAPASFGSTVAYAIQAIFQTRSKLGLAVINTGVVQTVFVPGFTSVSLDIDVSVDTNVPQNDDGIFETFQKMRSDKNFLFEEIVTSKARELFR